MNTRKTLAAAALGLGLVLTGASVAAAQTTTGTSTTSTQARSSFFHGFVTALSQRFNLNEADVTSFLNEQFAQRKADMEAKMGQAEAGRLAKAVSAGKLTQAQADLITAKQAEVKTQLEALRTSGKTGTELKDAMKSLEDSLKAWASVNGIPEQFVHPMAPRKGHGKGFGPMKRW